MNLIGSRLAQVRQRIRQAERDFSRPPGSVRLLAVSKTKSCQDIKDAFAAEQRCFGESYIQEALEKTQQLAEYRLEWHFIGRIQSNKTRPIAEHFDWVHSLASIKHARRLSQQRPQTLPPLKVCLQVNTSGEISKGGFPADQLEQALNETRELPGLQLCGLMTIPGRAATVAEQRRPFRGLRALRDRLAKPGCPLTTLSMGMTNDLEAAIAEGATIVRVGSAIFGPRS